MRRIDRNETGSSSPLNLPQQFHPSIRQHKKTNRARLCVAGALVTYLGRNDSNGGRRDASLPLHATHKANAAAHTHTRLGKQDCRRIKSGVFVESFAFLWIFPSNGNALSPNGFIKTN